MSQNLPIDEEKPVQLEITSFGRSVEAFYLKSDVCAETVIQQLQKILFWQIGHRSLKWWVVIRVIEIDGLSLRI